MEHSESKQSKGGKARAEALSVDEKKAIARKAALARWGKDLMTATHEGDFVLGDVLVSAAVLPNRQRLITQATFLRALGRSRSPKAGTGVWSTVDGVPFFLQAEALKPFLTEELLRSTTPIMYLARSGTEMVGYDARMLPNVADVYLKYRDAVLAANKPITERYRKIVAACDQLIRFLASRGIEALVDQATGYTLDVEREAFERLLERLGLSEQLRPYAKTFPVSWFKQMCRVRGIKFSPDMKLPKYVGKIVNDLIYDRAGVGVRQWLDRKTPVDANGRRKGKKFQWLTEEVGIKNLLHHIGIQEGILMGFGDGEWKAFKERLNRVMPPHPKLPSLFDEAIEQRLISGPASEPEQLS